jgi:hypothetical protein
MYKNQPTNDVTTKPSIEAFALPSELRRTHNFASRARPIIGLDLPLELTTAGSAVPSTALRFAHAPSRPTPSMPETDFLIESRLGDYDAARGLPQSWRAPQPAQPHKRRRRWTWSERSTAAFSGFAGGLIVVLPLIFMLGSHSPIAPTTDTSVRALNFSLASTAAYVENLWNDAGSSSKARTTQALTAAAGPVPVAEIETRALKALEAGQVDEARRTLRTAASPENPRLWLLLAQTYDPEASGISKPSATTGDVEFARFYYRQALANGIEAALPRLEALAPR